MAGNYLEGLKKFGSELGKVMSALRRRVDHAQLKGKQKEAEIAANLYQKAADLAHKRNQIVLKGIVEAQDIVDLMGVLSEAREKLDHESQRHAAIKKSVEQMKESLGKLETVLGPLV